MSRLDHLPEITDHLLYGLQAGPALKQRILEKAAQSGDSRSASFRRPAIALGVLSMLMIAALIMLGSLRVGGGTPAPDIQTVAAGSYRSISPVDLQEVIDETSAEDEAEHENAEDDEKGANDTAAEYGSDTETPED